MARYLCLKVDIIVINYNASQTKLAVETTITF